MEELLFTFWVMLAFILFLLGVKVLARIFYIVLFFPVILWINKILVWRVHQEKLQNKLKEKWEDGAIHYLVKYFEITQYCIGGILIILYSLITCYIFKNYTESYFVMWVISLLYFSYSFWVGRYKYKPKEDEDIYEVAIEWMENIDFWDLVNGIDFGIDIDI